MRILKLFSGSFMLFLALVFLSACSDGGHTENPQSLEMVFGKDSIGLFRSHQMGDSAEAIRATEPSIPLLDTDTLLKYNYTYNLESDTTAVDIFYTIDSYGLFEIQVDMRPETLDGTEELMRKTSAILTRKYGDYKKMGIVRRWTTNSPSNNLIEITLSNESEDAGEPFVSLNFLEPLPDEL